MPTVAPSSWHHQPHARPPGVDRRDLWRDAVRLVLPADHPAARRHRRAVPLAELAGDVWSAGRPGTGWEEMVRRTCRRVGGFDPEIRHRTNERVLTLGLVAAGEAVTLLPDLVHAEARRGVVVRAVAGQTLDRTIYAATRAADATRPSVQALLAAVEGATPRRVRKG